VLADSITVPFNDKEAARRAITENKDHVSAMIVEGMMGAAGQIPPKDDYLSFLRKVTADNDVLLILDEVQSFRLDYGGMQSIARIKPDLTALGKVIGGGYPVGAVGGREEIMELLSPEMHKVYHSGTFNANPVTATAGVTTLEQLTVEEIARINRLGENLAEGIRDVFIKLNIKGQVTGRGSLLNLHFNSVPVVDGRTAKLDNQQILHLLHLALMERGIFAASRGMFAISTPMTDKEIHTAVMAVEDSLAELQPYIEELWPELAV
jgi:glutamate-1-semialdehyde 2,1-aminomutase